MMREKQPLKAWVKGELVKPTDSPLLKCTVENWNLSWVCSQPQLDNTIRAIHAAGAYIVDIDRCECGGFHIWTDDIVQWFARQPEPINSE